MSRRPHILLAASEKFELSGIRPRADVQWTAVWAGGPGRNLMEQALGRLENKRFDGVVSLGLCGGADPALRLGQIIAGTHVNREAVCIPDGAGGAVSGPIASVEKIASREDKRALFSTGVLAVEMEAATVMQRVQPWGVPFYCIKVVSDTADEEFCIDFNAARDKTGRLRILSILGQALKKPRRGLPELERLRRRGQAGARALGEFLANCHF